MDVRRGKFGKQIVKYIFFFRRIAGYITINKKRNVDIYRELYAVPLLDYLENYRHNKTMHLHRMHEYRIPIQKKKQT